MKKNKNAVLRKSKSAQKKENEKEQTKSQMNGEPVDIKTQLSQPELDGETDSAIGSEVASVISMSFEDDNLLNDDLYTDLDNLTLNPNTEKTAQSEFFRAQQDPEFNSHQSGINTRQPAFVVPKLPVPQTRLPLTGYSTGKKAKHNRIRPECGVHASTAYQQDDTGSNNTERRDDPGSNNTERRDDPGSNNTERRDEQTDGEQSVMLALTTNDTLTTKLPVPPSLGSAASSLQTSSTGGMSDFVILHTDADIEDACIYMTHLLCDIGIDDLTVDLLSNIDAGKPGMQSLSTLHENYRYILTYITNNLESDKYCRFLQEIVLTFGLREANGKEDRVVPIFTKAGPCKIMEIGPLTGLCYFRFHSQSSCLSNLYLNSVRKLVRTGREKFP